MKRALALCVLLAGCETKAPSEVVDVQARKDASELRKKFDDDIRDAIAKLDARAAMLDKRQEELLAKEMAVAKRDIEASEFSKSLSREMNTVRTALGELGEKAGWLDAMQKKAAAQYEHARELPAPKVDPKALLAKSRAELEELRKSLPARQQALLNAMGKVTRLERSSNGSAKSVDAIEAAREEVRRIKVEQDQDAHQIEKLESIISDLSSNPR